MIVSGGGGAAQVNSAVLNVAYGIGGSGGGISGTNGIGKDQTTSCNAPGGKI